MSFSNLHTSGHSQNTDSFCLTKRIFDAFRGKGMMAGAYYSIADWNNNDYWWDYFPPKDRNINYPPEMFPEKWQRLNDFINNQLNELTGGKYGNLGMLWFDLCDASPDRHPQWERFAKTVRTNQPGIMMVARHTNTIYDPAYLHRQKPCHQYNRHNPKCLPCHRLLPSGWSLCCNPFSVELLEVRRNPNAQFPWKYCRWNRGSG